MTIRVALVDDQVLFRAGIAMLIGSQPDLDVVARPPTAARSPSWSRPRAPTSC
jgi:DNA-binding NarL/FixJ family response regulator